MQSGMLHFFAILSICVLLTGCGGGSDKTTKGELSNIVMMYGDYVTTFEKPPSSAEDLKKTDRVDPAAIQGIQDGRYVVVWGSDLLDQPEGISNVILAFEAKPHSSGKRWVVHADYSFAELTEEDFQKAPKLKPKKAEKP